MFSYKRATDLLLQAVNEVPDKVGFVDNFGEMTYKEMYESSLMIAKAIVSVTKESSVAIGALFETGNNLAAVIHGVLFADDYFSCMDESAPNERLEKIIETLEPAVIVTNRRYEEKARSLKYTGIILVYEDIIEQSELDAELPVFNDHNVSNKLAAVVFTSGSTGIPKGVMDGHGSILFNAISIMNKIGITSEDRFGNQGSLYYALGIVNMFATIAAKAPCYFMPKPLFSQPGELAKYLVENRISVIIWVASGITVMSRFEAWEGYEEEFRKNLKSVTFAGEVATTKLINKMRKTFPNVKYNQYYGATEFMFTACYPMEREIADHERIPLGFNTEFVNAYILKEDGTEAKDKEEGQICLAGPGIGLGYFKDEKLTAEKFQNNPIKDGEIIYMSGDIVQKNEYGEMVFKSRNDNMIKRMGHRIELGEIEIAACSLDDKMQCACIFDKEKEHIIMCYVGDMEALEIRKQLKGLIPQHMIPNKFIKLENLPFNQNNKIDRKKLIELYL